MGVIPNPLRGVAEPRQVWSWISFDVANQSFTLLINTLLWPIFLASVVLQDKDRGDVLWSVMYSASMVLTVLASPVMGAMADARACKKTFLVGTGLACGVLTCGLALVPAHGVLWAFVLYIPANFLYSMGENFLASFLPELARRDQVGRVSGFSWACAYGAALLLLVITAGAMGALGLKAPEDWRAFFVFAGLWFIAFAVPTMVILRERARPVALRAGRSAVGEGFARLRETLVHARKHRDLLMLLAASLFYGTAMNVVIVFASRLAQDFGFSDVDLVIFTAVITVSGIVGTLGPTLFQDRIGHRRTTVILLVIWLATALGLAWVAHQFALSANPQAFPRWPLWVAGNLLGLGLGSLGSANRAFVAYLTPASRSGEYFGLWGLVFKLAAVGTVPFALVKAWLGMAESLLVLAGFVVVGLAVTMLVNERRGAEAAREEGKGEGVDRSREGGSERAEGR